MRTLACPPPPRGGRPPPAKPAKVATLLLHHACRGGESAHGHRGHGSRQRLSPRRVAIAVDPHIGKQPQGIIIVVVVVVVVAAAAAAAAVVAHRVAEGGEPCRRLGTVATPHAHTMSDDAAREGLLHRRELLRPPQRLGGPPLGDGGDEPVQRKMEGDFVR